MFYRLPYPRQELSNPNNRGRPGKASARSGGTAKSNQRLKDENEHLKQEVKSWKYAFKNSRFDIERYKEQDDVITFYTGFSDFAAMNLCYKLVEESAKNISYKVEGVYDDCRNSSQQVGRPRPWAVRKGPCSSI